MKSKFVSVCVFTCAFAALSSSASFAQNLVCTSTGRALSMQGGTKGYTDSKLEFALDQSGGALQLKKVSGWIKVNEFEPKFDSDNGYTGEFNTAQIDENKNYKPRKYLGYAQFQNLDAVKSSGQESGMWGELLVERKDRGGKRSAHYIFRAGDHIGGTLHFSCKSAR